MRNRIEQERHRLILWLPVWFAVGAMLYLSLRLEPAGFVAAIPIAPSAWLTYRAWRRGWMVWLGLAAITVMLLGFAWMQVYTQWNGVTMLKRELSIRDVTGRMVEISDVPAGYRVTLDDVMIEELKTEETPKRIRVKLRGDGEQLLTGQRIAVRAGLLPPTGPVMPGAFDFARYFYFKGIGAVGYAIPPATVLKAEKERGFWLWLTRQREALSDRIRSQMSMPEGAVAAALMTGDRAAIPEHVNQVMRDTNLSHILAISGMHMALVAGLLFICLRWLLAVLPFTRHVRNAKKLAAFLALMAGAAYLCVAGFPVSACRAYVMVALVFAAILLDRQVMPMRSLAMAAMLLLLMNPSYAMQPGFQLSFAATAALIAWYERVRATAERFMGHQDRRKRLMIYVGGIVMTTLVAEVATAPLVLYHFNTVSFYGLLANLIIMPIVTFWIMPCIVISFLLLPVGLEFIPLQPVEWGISAMIMVADWVAGIPGAQTFMPAMPGWGMALVGLGYAWLIIWKTRWRFYGLIAIATGLLSLLTAQPPDMLISADGKQIAGRVSVCHPEAKQREAEGSHDVDEDPSSTLSPQDDDNCDHKLMMLKGRAKSFTPEQWANGSGESALPYAPKEHEAWKCDAVGCVYRYQQHTIAVANSFEAQAEDCRRAQLVISPFYLSARECDAQIIDRRAREQRGGHWLWLGDDMTVETTSDIQGKRPWSR